MNALRRLRAVARKELKILLRDRFYLLIAVGMPVLTLITMGYGINYDVKGLPLGVADLDVSAESRRFTDAFTAAGYFRLALATTQAAELDRAMQAGRIRAAVVIPPGFARALYRGTPAPAQVLIDGSFPVRAEIVRGYVTAVVVTYNRERLQRLALRYADGDARVPSIDVVNRVWFNPTLESKNFLIPGLVVLSLLFWSPLLVSLTVTREKESGAILNVQTAPLAPWEYVAGKLVPYAGITFAAYWLLILTSTALFRVPVRGDMVTLTLGAFLYVLGMSAIGLLISMLVRTQVAALLATGVLVMAIGLFYSGWSEPVSTLSSSGRVLSRLLPTASFGTLARGVILKGLGFSAYRSVLLLLGGYAVLYAALATAAFRKRVR